MRVGTKSVLFGAHQFVIHPLFVALAWWRIYGIPLDPRLWIAFFIHDLGYWGKPNMDGPEGESHPYFAAKLMGALFGPAWFDFCLLHSRFIAKQHRKPFSRLCAADKLAVAMEPWWLYLPRAIVTGEINEYMRLADSRTAAGEPKFAHMKCFSDSRLQWFENVKIYLHRWVAEFSDGSEDTWTPESGVKAAADSTGTYM